MAELAGEHFEDMLTFGAMAQVFLFFGREGKAIALNLHLGEIEEPQ